MMKPELFRMPASAALGDAVVMNVRQVISGVGSVRRIGEIAKPHGKSALVVTHGPGRMRASGAVEVALASLSERGISSTIFEVSQTPTAEEIDEGAAMLRAGGFAMSIGIGGGSALDASKAISLLSTNGDRWEHLQVDSTVIRSSGPAIIAVPTTAGSGSEATAVAVIRNKNLGVIKSVSHPFMIPTATILDSSLVVSGNASLHAVVGLDAFSHAIESYTSPRASDLTKRISISALNLIVASLPKVVAGNPSEADYANTLLGSHLAGQALSAGVGGAHVLAQPISAVLGVNHGTAISLVLEEVVRFNEALPQDPYRELTNALSAGTGASLRMSDFVRTFMAQIEVSNRPQSYGRVHTIPKILEAVENSTGHIWTNPRRLSLEALEGILLRSWGEPPKH